MRPVVCSYDPLRHPRSHPRVVNRVPSLPTRARRFSSSTSPPSAVSLRSTRDWRIWKRPTRRAVSVCVGFPCNQFMGQEPGTAEEIQTFCSTTYGVTFPLFEKIDVNGDDRHPIYEQLVVDSRRRGLQRRHSLELREVPGVPRRLGAAFRPSGDARGSRPLSPRSSRRWTSRPTGDEVERRSDESRVRARRTSLIRCRRANAPRRSQTRRRGRR